MAAQGITTAVATPHQLGRYEGCNDSAAVRQKVRELNDRLRGENILLEVLPGGDIRLDERIPRLLREDAITSLADRNAHLLLEMPPEFPVDPQPLFDELISGRITPIVSHPERCRWLSQSPQTIDRWLNQGVWVQITAGALLGQFGPQIESSAWSFLALGGPIVVASDSHGARNRPPCLPAAAQAIAQRLGPSLADRACGLGPEQVLKGLSALPA